MQVYTKPDARILDHRSVLFGACVFLSGRVRSGQGRGEQYVGGEDAVREGYGRHFHGYF